MDLALNNLQRLICHKTQQKKKKERHYRIERYIHLEVCKYNGILDCEKWSKHRPEPIGATIYWDVAIQTERKIKSNWSDNSS